ncbi:MAG: tryptophan--tRNA ligase, partial [Candidatus Omnitrophota bacterium]
ECNVFSYYGTFLAEQVSDARLWCEGAAKGCTDCKKNLAEAIIEYLRPIRERRLKVLADRGYVEDVLKKGAEKARDIAQLTMKEVRTAVFR